MTANTVNVNVTDNVITLNPESDAFIGERGFTLHALPDDFQVNSTETQSYVQSYVAGHVKSSVICQTTNCIELHIWPTVQGLT